MKIVTMCRGGNVRSVAAKMILHRYFKHEVIAIGADNTNDQTKKLLFDWADKIVVMSAEFLSFLNIQGHYENGCVGLFYDYNHKAILLDVGQDIWGNPFAIELQLKILDLLSADIFLDITKGKYINAGKVVRMIESYKEKIRRRNTNDVAL